MSRLREIADQLQYWLSGTSSSPLELELCASVLVAALSSLLPILACWCSSPSKPRSPDTPSPQETHQQLTQYLRLFVSAHLPAELVANISVLFYAAYDIAYTPLIVSYYGMFWLTMHGDDSADSAAVEILPYNLRAKGFTIFALTVSTSLIVNQYINPVVMDE